MLWALIGLYLVAGFIIARLMEEAYAEEDEGFKLPLIFLIALVWLPCGLYTLFSRGRIDKPK